VTGYDPGRYGKAVGGGGDYDAMYPSDSLETEASVAMLIGLARGHAYHSVLELGIGTGRIALALRAAGIRVAGIDGSEAMVAQLREKPGGKEIEVTIGDYRDAQVDARYGVVLLGFNGILDPRGREAQRDIFDNAARHLAPGGRFVVESLVLSDAQRSGEWSVNPRYVGEEHVELQVMRYDMEANRIERTLVHLRPGGPTFVSVFDTYASPGELDLMAESAGLMLRSRSADWAGADFTSTSARHVSVYEAREGRSGGEPA
jgi:SAM-dependent methyltransferase